MIGSANGKIESRLSVLWSSLQIFRSTLRQIKVIPPVDMIHDVTGRVKIVEGQPAKGDHFPHSDCVWPDVALVAENSMEALRSHPADGQESWDGEENLVILVEVWYASSDYIV